MRESWLDRPLSETFGRVGFPSRHRILKQLLGLWAIAYPILIFLPLISTGTSNAGATTVGVLAMIVVGSTLFFPWIIGLIVLGVLVAVS